MENISLRQNLKESWGIFKKHNTILISATFILIVVALLGKTNNALLSAVSFMLGIVFQMGFIKIVLDILDDTKPNIKTIVSQAGKFLKYFFMVIIVTIIISGPVMLVNTLLLLLPTEMLFTPVIFSIANGALVILIVFLIIPRLMFSNMILVDTNENAWHSVKTSFNLTKNYYKKTVMLFLMVVSFNIVGVALFGLGLLISIPISLLMLSKFYRQISGKIMPVLEEEAPKEIVEIENTPA